MANIIDFKKANKTHIEKIDKIYVKINSCLSVQDYTDAINEIVSSCFTNEKFTPEYRTLGERYVVLNFFTDIDVSDVSLDDLFEITQSSWYDKILDIVTTIPVYSEITKAVDEIIKYRQNDMYQLSHAIEIAANADIEGTLREVNNTLDKAKDFDSQKYVDAAIEVAAQKVAIKNGES